ncbi:Sulfotransferase cytosolic 1B member 1 [Bulinus truncatus]|nr:Sulfotransferase cytosolic 1B member 1 [Bulinus truncatus]
MLLYLVELRLDYIIIHVIRNPKDVITSGYWHVKSMLGLEGLSFEIWVNATLSGQLSTPTIFDYLNQMAEFEQLHPDHPIKHVYFEEMKKDPVKTVKDLAQFLSVPASDELCTNIVNACSFEQMKKIELAGAKDYPEPLAEMCKSITFYRKGQIGDWKNHFTVSLNERFDEFIGTAMKNKQLKFKFIYE